MTFDSSLARGMPDVACEQHPAVAGTLARVGMQRIEALLTLPLDGGDTRQLAARVDAYVDLQAAAVRGIHMSRLYRAVDAQLATAPLTPALLRALLTELLDSQQGLSQRADLRIAVELPLRRRALVSSHSGIRHYPVVLAGSLMRGGRVRLELGLAVTYASTCPCSAALARQLIQQRFAQDFPADRAPDHAAVLAWLGSEQGIAATPHSQRSRADLRLRLGDDCAHWPIQALLDAAEAALGTPVQTAVRREDEQAFALRNGGNLMFCEDAARRLAQMLAARSELDDYWLQVAHFESLHPHDAVALACKGVAGGYDADSTALG